MEDFEAEANLARYAQLQDVRNAAQSSGTQIVDARSKEQYDGTVRRAQHAGHVKGARSLPYGAVVEDSTGGLKDPGQIEQICSSAGIDPQQGGIVYCNGGVSACVVAAALEAVSSAQWRVYDGSWNEIGNLDDAPIEAG